MTWKKVNNSDPGTATKHGGNDIDKIADALSGVDVSDPIIYSVDINTLKANTNALGDILKSNGTKYLRFPKGTANQIPRVNNAGTDLAYASVLAGTNVTVTHNANDITIAATGGGGGGDVTGAANVGSGTGTIFRDEVTGVLNLKTLLAGTNITLTNNANDVTIAASGGGGGANVQAYSYFVYIDSATGIYKALNAVTGAVDYSHGTSGSDADIGTLLGSIFAGVSSSVPLAIVMGKGDFVVRSWDNANTARSNFSIVGQGMGITRFMVTNEIETAGDTIAMRFEPGAGSTTTTLSSNCTKGSASISVTSAASFAVNDDIILCSDEDWDTALAAADRTQINRIVSISGTTIMLEKFANETFNTASNARIIKQTVLRNIYLANFSLEAASTFTNEGTAFLHLGHCDKVTCENIGMKGMRGAYHKALITTMVTNSTFTNFKMELKLEHFVETWVYAISCRAACENIIYSNFMLSAGFRHGFTTTTDQSGVKDGVPKDIFIVDCMADTAAEAAWDTHGEGENIYFINCQANGYRSAGSTDTVAGVDDTDGFNMRNKHTHIINPMVSNTRGHGINFSPASHDISVQGGSIKYVKNGKRGINLESGSTNIKIDGIFIDEVDREGIQLNGSNHNTQITDVFISSVGNSATSSAIKITNSTDVRITGRINVGAQKAIELTGTTDWTRIDANCRGSAASTLVGSNNITIGSMGL